MFGGIGNPWLLGISSWVFHICFQLTHDDDDDNDYDHNDGDFWNLFHAMESTAWVRQWTKLALTTALLTSEG